MKRKSLVRRPRSRHIAGAALAITVTLAGCGAAPDGATGPGGDPGAGPSVTTGTAPGPVLPAAGTTVVAAAAGAPTPAGAPTRPGGAPAPAPHGNRPVVSTIVPAPPLAGSDPGDGLPRQKVRFGAVELEVPAGWPVHDLSRAPRTCVRWSPSAVFLGTPSADQDCPAQAAGNDGGVLVEPLAGAPDPAPGEARTSGQIAGHPAVFEGDPAASGLLVARVPDLGIRVVVALGGSRSFGDRTLNSIKEIKP